MPEEPTPDSEDGVAPWAEPIGTSEEVIEGIARDITERQRADEALMHLAAIFQTSDDAIVGKTLDGIITSWNPAAERLFGYTADEAKGQPISILVPPERADDLPQILTRIRRGERIDHYETVRKHKDGRRVEVSVSMSPILDRAGTIIGAATIARDITERKRAEEERERLLRQVEAERARFQAIFESTFHGIVFVEAGTDRVLVNPAGIRTLGRPIVPEAGRTQYVQQALHPDGRPMTTEELPSTRALQGEAVPEQEFLVRRPDGTQVPVLASASPVRGPAGDVTGAVVVFQDIARLKELERLREEWISVIAHDLRQPIQVVSGYAGMLQRLVDRQTDPQTGRILDHLRTTTSSLGRMVADLLDASRIEARRLALERQSVDLAQLVREVVERTAEVTRGHPVCVEVEEPIPSVGADPGRIEQVLGNLLSNAAKYGEPENEILVEVAHRGGEVQVSVTNRGEGIALEDLPKLFSRFHRARQTQAGRAPGLGLGLYITRGLVEAHGGRVWAESTPGQATSFHFTLPLAEAGIV